MLRRWWSAAFLLLTLLVFTTPARAHWPPVPQGVVSVDTKSHQQLRQLLQAGYMADIPWSDAYGQYIDVPAYIPNLTVEETWDYIQNIYNLPQWTMSVRYPQPMSDFNGRTRYMAQENLPPGGTIYFLEEKNPAIHTIDWWVGHSPEDIWMHYYFRVLDAQEWAGKPGVLITWVNFGHANFERDPALTQAFLMMEIAHGIERSNLIKILQWRAQGHTEAPDIQTQIALGLINIDVSDPMGIWGMIAAQVQPTVPWSYHYGNFIGSHFYLPDNDVDTVFNYLKEPFHMNQWTVSFRNAVHFGPVVTGIEHLTPDGLLLGKQDVHTPSRTIDLQFKKVGQGCHVPLWMNSTLRIMSAPEANGKPGTVVVWISYRHVMYDSSPDLTELWTLLPVKNKYAAENIRLFLAQ